MALISTQAQIAPRLLWFDLTHDQSAPDQVLEFSHTCQVKLVRDLSAAGVATQHRPDMICMHYDHPDTFSLDLLIAVKRAAPSIPITMLTMQHSEELAVWAFRSGVWDYLVLPLPQSERNRYLNSLRELCRVRSTPDSNKKQLIITRTCNMPESVRLTADHHKQNGVQKAVQYIELHFKEHIDQKELADRCGMSPFRFSRLFKLTYGIGFLEFIQRKRMEEAEALLNNSEMPITSIAYSVGFQDPSYFARAFKQHFGRCPSDFRRDPTNTPHANHSPDLDETKAQPPEELLPLRTAR